MASVFKIYSSSAGSGKTYALTKEYLKLALHSPNPDYYRAILAITFTNDAAAEMKERILGALRGFNDDTLSDKTKQKSENLLEEITAELQQDYPEQQLNKEEVRRRAELVFRQVLYNYADFSVSTIDSFVNKIVQAFARELNIPHNFEVDLDSNTLLNTAVSLLLDKVKNEKGDLLTETLEQFILEKASEGRSWSKLTEELADFARNLLNEQVYEAITDLQQLTLEDFREVQRELRETRKQIEEAIVEPASQAVALIEQANLDAADLSYGKNGIYGYFYRWLKTIDLNYSNSNARKTVENDSWYSASAKKNSFIVSQIDSIKGQLSEYYL
ncbi:MAG TPA: UvrD-helicase domain-containing protein, partial [Pontibacter sp.]